MPPRKLPSLRKPEPFPDDRDDAASTPPMPADPAPRRGGLPRFGTRMLLLLMLVGAVAAATMGGVRNSANREFYVVFALAAPLALLVLVGVFYEVVRRRR
ncbi:MAG: hypothetical protein AAGB00_10050 [Planctomycetota bacterium]